MEYLYRIPPLARARARDRSPCPYAEVDLPTRSRHSLRSRVVKGQPAPLKPDDWARISVRVGRSGCNGTECRPEALKGEGGVWKVGGGL